MRKTASQIVVVAVIGFAILIILASTGLAPVMAGKREHTPASVSSPASSSAPLSTAQLDSPPVLAAAAGEFVQQILSRSGQLSAVTVSFQNNSGMPPESQEAVQNGIFTAFRNANVRVVQPGQGQAEVEITFSENWQSYVWIANIKQPTRSQMVMKQLPRSEHAPVVRAPALTVRKSLVWQQDGPILDFHLEKDHLVVLEPDQVAIYSQDSGLWRPRYTLAVTHQGSWPRDLRGRVQVNGSQITAFLPGTRCVGSTSPPSLDCRASDDPWPVDQNSVVAFYSTRRNFFTGLLSGPSAGASVIPFFSAAAWQNGDARLWLFTGIDGRTRFYQFELTAPVAIFNNWGSNMAAVHSNCSTGWQVLATAPTDSIRADSVQAVEIIGREALPVSSAVELAGPVEALWTTGKNSEMASGVVRSLATGKYEAFILQISCGQ